MLSDLISSKTRIKLLLKFFLNSSTKAYLRGLSDEFGESTNAIRLELNRLEGAGMLSSFFSGNKKIYQANTGHPLYNEMKNIVHKHLGIDQLIITIVDRLGALEQAYLTGPFSSGIDSPIIDLILVGDIELGYLAQLIRKAESLLARKIRYVHYLPNEWKKERLKDFEYSPMLIWDKNQVFV